MQIVSGDVGSATEAGTTFLLLLVVGVLMRICYGMVLRGTANSVLLVALTHTMFNRSNGNEGIGAAVLDGENRQLAALVATVLLIIVLGLLLGRRRLSRSYRQSLDEAEHRSAAAASFSTP